MLFEEFTKLVEKETRKQVKNSAEVSLSIVYKNNGVKLTAIRISDGIHNIAPTIYLNDYFTRFKQGMELDQIIQDILRFHYEHLDRVKFNVSDFSKLDKVKHTFAYKLINYDKNRELLKDVPHVVFLDLAIVFYCAVEMEEYGRATVLIHNDHLGIWNITKEELVKLARENAPRILPCEITSMREVVRKMMSEELFLKQTEALEYPPLYVLTNTQSYFGAAAMLYPKVLRDFAEASRSNLIILPSSIHEVLLVPAYREERLEEFNEMVEEVNAMHVEEQEVLSDHIYYFDRKTGEITIP